MSHETNSICLKIVKIDLISVQITNIQVLLTNRISDKIFDLISPELLIWHYLCDFVLRASYIVESGKN